MGCSAAVAHISKHGRAMAWISDTLLETLMACLWIYKAYCRIMQITILFRLLQSVIIWLGSAKAALCTLAAFALRYYSSIRHSLDIMYCTCDEVAEDPQNSCAAFLRWSIQKSINMNMTTNKRTYIMLFSLAIFSIPHYRDVVQSCYIRQRRQAHSTVVVVWLQGAEARKFSAGSLPSECVCVNQSSRLLAE